MGPTLPHEHVLVDFVGAREASRDRYDSDEVYRIALPHLKRVREQGIRTLVDCTPAYLGRDPALLRRLSESSGLNILTPTGYYGAGAASSSPTMPGPSRPRSWRALAREWREGIEGTGIRPGFIKLGADAGPLPEVHRKLVRAAARTHRESGLTIAAHSGDGVAALEALEILRRRGSPARPSSGCMRTPSRTGDGTSGRPSPGRGSSSTGSAPRRSTGTSEPVRSMKEAGHLGRVLLSHDAGWYHVGEPAAVRTGPTTR